MTATEAHVCAHTPTRGVPVPLLSWAASLDWRGAVPAAIIALLVTLAVEYAAKPGIEVRKQRILQDAKNVRELGDSLVTLRQSMHALSTPANPLMPFVYGDEQKRIVALEAKFQDEAAKTQSILGNLRRPIRLADDIIEVTRVLHELTDDSYTPYLLLRENNLAITYIGAVNRLLGRIRHEPWPIELSYAVAHKALTLVRKARAHDRPSGAASAAPSPADAVRIKIPGDYFGTWWFALTKSDRLSLMWSPFEVLEESLADRVAAAGCELVGQRSFSYGIRRRSLSTADAHRVAYEAAKQLQREAVARLAELGAEDDAETTSHAVLAQQRDAAADKMSRIETRLEKRGVSFD
jgi:hypothetical protein